MPHTGKFPGDAYGLNDFWHKIPLKMYLVAFSIKRQQTLPLVSQIITEAIKTSLLTNQRTEGASSTRCQRFLENS